MIYCKIEESELKRGTLREEVACFGGAGRRGVIFCLFLRMASEGQQRWATEGKFALDNDPATVPRAL